MGEEGKDPAQPEPPQKSNLTAFMPLWLFSLHRTQEGGRCWAPLSGLGDAVHLVLAPYVILELGNQGKDAHDQLAGARRGVDRWVIHDLEADALLGELGNDA